MLPDRSRTLRLTALAALLLTVLLGVGLARHGRNAVPTAISPSPTAAAPSSSPIASSTATVSASPVTAASASPAGTASIPLVSPSPTPPPPAGSHEASGDAAYKSGQYATAAQEYQLQIAATSEPVAVAALWNKTGNAFRENKQGDQALSAYDAAIKYNPKLGDAYLNKAAALWQSGKKDEARAALKAGLDAAASRSQDLQNSLDIYNSFSQ